jgi:pre-mRNA-splicing factor SYF1
VRTVDPERATGKPHTLWVAFAKLYERHSDLPNARIIFEKAVQVGGWGAGGQPGAWWVWCVQ